MIYGEIGFEDELMLYTPDMIVEELERLETQSEDLDRQIMELSKVRAKVNGRYNLMLGKCPHKRGEEWATQAMTSFGPCQVRCDICHKQITCQHPDPYPYFGGMYCDRCDHKKSYNVATGSGNGEWRKVQRE